MCKYLVLFSSLVHLAGLFCPVRISAQEKSTQIRIEGEVRDERNQRIPNIIIINRTTRAGGFGKPDGTFTIQCDKKDTLTITSLGYFPRSVCFADSAMKDSYRFVTYLEQRTYRLAQVEIFAPRDLEKIQDDIRKLGYDESDYKLSGINAAISPITFLYQQFSRKEQSRRQVAELENDDLKRELLRELFHYYVDYEIIQLDNSDFDEFIEFLNVSDEFLKSSSQYDFLIYVKDRFADYRIWKRRKGLREGDFNYDND